MAFSVQMPALGESVTEGTVTRWLKEEGDTVEADEPLLEVSTDKVDTEIPAPTSGVLTKIIAQEDDVVEVGGDLALIGDADEAGSDDSDSDAAGGDAYNLALSQRRSEALAEALAQASGLPRSRFVASGRGERDLKNPYAPEAGENRRVQILLVGR